MKKVGIVMGSDSDMPVMSKAAAILDKLGVEYEMKIISAHREPDVFFEYAKSAEERGFKVIIAGAGMAAHLPVFQCILHLWEDVIHCTQLYRCHPEFRLRQLQSTEEQMQDCWQPRSWLLQIRSFLRNSKNTAGN